MDKQQNEVEWYNWFNTIRRIILRDPKTMQPYERTIQKGAIESMIKIMEERYED